MTGEQYGLERGPMAAARIDQLRLRREMASRAGTTATLARLFGLAQRR
jgi:hypothetical protein